jgi:type I restriction enzyme S subunit
MKAIFPERRLKYVATINEESLPETTPPDYELQYLDISSVTSTGEILDATPYTFDKAPSRARRQVRHGDVIISTVRTYLLAIAAIEHPADNLIVSTGFAVIRSQPDVLLPQFCKYLLREASFIAEVQRRSVGVSYPAVNASDLGDIFVPLPTLAQQEAIADFLDYELQRLDQLAEARQRQLALLEEKRRAIIAQAVTKGLDAQAPSRDSGFPWLDCIPAHWQVVRLRFLAEVRGGLTKGRKYENAQPLMLPYVRVANVQAGYLDLSDMAEIEVLEEEIERYSLKYGDVLMNEGGDADKLGRGAMWREEIKPCLHQNHVFAVRCFAVNPEWLAKVSNSEYSKAYFESRARQSTNLASISSTNIKEFPVVMPPASDQRAILNFIEREETRVGALRTAIETSLDLLQQKRASLITAAVTGQLTLPVNSHVSA